MRSTQHGPRRAAAVVVLAIVGLVATATAAAGSARVVLDRSRAAPGDTVNGTAEGFLPALPAEVRLGSPEGKLLWSGSAGTGSFTFKFATPDVAPGRYTIFAFSSGDSTGAARAALEVLARPPAPGGASAAQPAADGGPPPPQVAGREGADGGGPQRVAGSARGPALGAASTPVEGQPQAAPQAPLVADADPPMAGPLSAPGPQVAGPEVADGRSFREQLAVARSEGVIGPFALLHAARASDGFMALAAVLLVGILRRQRPRPALAAGAAAEVLPPTRRYRPRLPRRLRRGSRSEAR